MGQGGVMITRRNVPSLRSAREAMFGHRTIGLHIVQPKDGKQLDLFEDYVPPILRLDLETKFRDYYLARDVEVIIAMAYSYGEGPVHVCKLYNNS